MKPHLKSVSDTRGDDEGVEYEIGNKPSLSASDDEAVAGENASDKGYRVVMMYDDNGRATPMPMDRFYYDNVRGGEEEDDEDELSEACDEKSPSDSEHASRRANSRTPNASRSDSAPKRGGDCSESRGEESDDGREADDSQDADDTEEPDDDGQFMRIQVVASSLKTVDKVVKDLDHDKVQKRSRVFNVGSMVRALSSVHQSASGADRKRSVKRTNDSVTAPHTNASKDTAAAAKPPSKQTSGRQGLSAVGRMLSLSKEKKSNTPPANSSQAHAPESHSNAAGAPARPSEPPMSTKSSLTTPKRQGIGAVGRMLSFSKKTGASADKAISTPPAAQHNVAANLDRGKGENGPDVDGKSVAHQLKQVRINASDDTPSHLNAQPVPAGGRHENQPDGLRSASAHTPDDSRSNNSQLSPVDRDRKESPQQMLPAARLGLKQTGRMLSLSRKQGSSTTPPASAVHEDQSTAPDSARSRDRDRADTNPSAKRENSRVGLKAAGRLLSFSRKPDKVSASPQSEKSVTSASSASTPASPAGAAGLSISPRLDGRANRFFFSEINSESIKRSTTLANETHIRIPVLVMAEYSGPVSKTKWFIDAFTLPHNAVRRECIDLYDILMALARCRGDLDITREDMQDFHGWWVVAERFFNCYFEMERTVLFPWVDAAGSKDWELQMALNKMRNMKEGLQEQLKGISEIWRGIDAAPPGELFAQIYKGVDTFCPRIMNYFADQELLLPAIVKGVYTIEDRLALDKDMLESFMDEPLSRKNKDLPHHNLVLLIRWIANPRQLRAWIAKNLNSTGRAAYSKWHTAYEEDHARVVKMFRNRSRMTGKTPSPDR